LDGHLFYRLHDEFFYDQQVRKDED
jgi:hypothetical protein